MNNRLKEIRKFLNLNQQEFADKLGVSFQNVSSYEQGRRNPSNAVISLICEKFGISETWLRDGTGEMFKDMSRENEIAKMVAEAQLSEDFRYHLLSCLASLDVNEWKLLENIADKLKNEDKIKE